MYAITIIRDPFNNREKLLLKRIDKIIKLFYLMLALFMLNILFYSDHLNHVYNENYTLE